MSEYDASSEVCALSVLIIVLSSESISSAEGAMPLWVDLVGTVRTDMLAMLLRVRGTACGMLGLRKRSQSWLVRAVRENAVSLSRAERRE